MTAGAQDRLGTVLDGKYHLDSVLGQGMMGVVFQATPVVGDSTTPVAIKVLSGRWTADDRTAKRFQREGEMLARLDHPNILRMHLLAMSDDDTPYMVSYRGRGSFVASANILT
jgi:serine/threonine-protein kinase